MKRFLGSVLLVLFGLAMVSCSANGVDKSGVSSSMTTESAGAMFPMVPQELVFDFSDEIPQSITWYEIYISHGEVKCPSLSIPHLIETVGENTVLPVRINLAAVLDSDVNIDPIYRVFRIICQYEEQTVEYNVLFDLG